jgi:acetyltransferase
VPNAQPPPAIVENWALLDGAAATLRPIRASDMELERAFVRNLSPQSKFKHFMGELKELSPEQLHAFTHPDRERESVYVVIRSTAAGEEEIAVARYVLEPGGRSCEFAITVADAWQGKGVAGRLMRALIRDARMRGLERMDGFVLGTNARMLAFVRRLGFCVELDRDDPAVRIARLDLRAPAEG